MTAAQDFWRLVRINPEQSPILFLNKIVAAAMPILQCTQNTWGLKAFQKQYI